EHCDLGESGESVRDPAFPTCRTQHRAGFPQRGLGIVDATARERKVRRPPERARKAPAITSTPKHLAGLGEMALPASVLAGGRVDQTESHEHKTKAAPITLRAAQLERLLEMPASRRERKVRELKVRAPDQHGRPAALIA